MKMAEIIEQPMPMASVYAKPWMLPAPKIISTTAAINVVTLESKMAEKAR